MNYLKGQLSSTWQNVIREGLGMSVNQGYCSEGMRFLHQRDGVPTSMEVHINLSLRIIDADMGLVFLPIDPDMKECTIRLDAEELARLLDELVRLADNGIVPTAYSGGTRTDFVVRVDAEGILYIIPPNTRGTPRDVAIPESLLFLSERLLNFVEAL